MLKAGAFYAVGAAAALATIDTTETIWHEGNSLLKGITVEAENARYAVHNDSNARKPDRFTRIHDARHTHASWLIEQGASLEQVEKMMDLQDRWERKEAEKAYNAAFAAFKAEAVRIVKGRKVTDGPLRGKEYAELHDVVDAVTPALSRHGLSTEIGRASCRERVSSPV